MAHILPKNPGSDNRAFRMRLGERLAILTSFVDWDFQSTRGRTLNQRCGDSRSLCWAQSDGGINRQYRMIRSIPMLATQPHVDLAAVKSRQHATWSSGDYAVIGTTLSLTGELLCEAVDLRPGERVLDVAAGNGNATLAAARRFADVTSTDYVPALLDRGRAKAAAERLDVTFQEADAESLPFADHSFDVVLSVFGVMFTPNQEQAAQELLRVCRPGGTIGLANWTPEGFIGHVFRTIGKYVPPPAGLKPPALWGSEQRLGELFGAGVSQLTTNKRIFVFRYRSAEHFVDVFRTYYGPVLKAFAALDEAGQASLAGDLAELLERFNQGGSETLAVPSEYLEVVATRA
jgi:SAM-dependent methyltransferase